MALLDGMRARLRHLLRNLLRRDRVERELTDELDGYVDLLLLDLIDAAELPAGGPAGVVPGHALRDLLVNLTGAGTPERLFAVQATPNLFPTLGVDPLVGRWFVPPEGSPGRTDVAVLSYGLWQRRFGAERGIVGRTIRLDGRPHLVVGVMPRGFQFPREDVQLWTPVDYRAGAGVQGRGTFFLSVVGRVKPGVSLEQVNVELAAVARALAETYPENADIKGEGLDEPNMRGTVYMPASQLQQTGVFSPRALAVRTTSDPAALAAAVQREIWAIDPGQAISSVQTLESVVDGQLSDRKVQTWLLTAFAGLALFMAALGVYGMLSFVVTSRMRELGVRTAMGAQRGDLVSLIGRESAIWVSCGLVGGLALAMIVSRSMRTLIYGVEPLDWVSVATSWSVLAVAAGLAALLPLWRATRVDPMTVLRAE